MIIDKKPLDYGLMIILLDFVVLVLRLLLQIRNILIQMARCNQLGYVIRLCDLLIALQGMALVMEFAEGGDLEHLLAEYNNLITSVHHFQTNHNHNQ
mgnify:CR=1 FL=1